MTRAQAQILMVSLIEEKRTLAALTGRMIKHKIAAGGMDSAVDYEVLQVAELMAKAQLGLDRIVEELQTSLR